MKERAFPISIAPVLDVRADEYRAPQQSDFSLTGRGGKKLPVLGGGIAGPATAYGLGKAGYDCRIAESERPPQGT